MTENNFTWVVDINENSVGSCQALLVKCEVKQLFSSHIVRINPNYIHKSQSLFNLTTALHVSGVAITHLQEHKTTVTTASGNRYTVNRSQNLPR
jgi:hypothetical protein